MRSLGATERPRLGFGTKLGYGLGSTAFGIASQALSTSIISQYLFIVVGVPAVLIGTAIMISQIVDALVDPLLGQWSDNVRTPWGRRHPFMYAAAIPGALAFYALWHPPTTWPIGQLFGYMVVVLIIVRFFNAMYEIPSSALAPELAPGYDDRTSLQSYRFVFTVAGAGSMIALLNGVFLRHDATHTLGILNGDGYSQWGTIGAVTIFVSIVVSSLATHRFIPRLSAPVPTKASPAQVFRDIRSTLSNRSLLALVISGLFSAIGGGVTAAMSPYMNLYFWNLSPQLVGLMTLSGIPATFLGAVLAPMLSRRFDKKPTMMALFAVAVVSSLLPVGLRLIGLMPANGTPLLAAILVADTFLGIVLYLMGFIIASSMLGDIVEDNAVRTGKRAEGLLFAANLLVPKLSGGVGAFLGSVIVTLVQLPSHAQQGTIPAPMLRELGLIYLPVSAIMNGLAIAVMATYRIDRTTHQKNLEALEAINR
jgi:glycoside/pentoside/hexuronide:cation symporter, GPH family